MKCRVLRSAPSSGAVNDDVGIREIQNAQHPFVICRLRVGDHEVVRVADHAEQRPVVVPADRVGMLGPG